jgi:hypothetical protein
VVDYEAFHGGEVQRRHGDEAHAFPFF